MASNMSGAGESSTSRNSGRERRMSFLQDDQPANEVQDPPINQVNKHHNQINSYEWFKDWLSSSTIDFYNLRMIEC